MFANNCVSHPELLWREGDASMLTIAFEVVLELREMFGPFLLFVKVSERSCEVAGTGFYPDGTLCSQGMSEQLR